MIDVTNDLIYGVTFNTAPGQTETKVLNAKDFRTKKIFFRPSDVTIEILDSQKQTRIAVIDGFIAFDDGLTISRLVEQDLQIIVTNRSATALSSYIVSIQGSEGRK